MKKKKLPPLRETEAFQELLKNLRKQTPDQHDRLKAMLDEIIKHKVEPDENA